MTTSSILVSGTNGFVGGAVLDTARSRGLEAGALVRDTGGRFVRAMSDEAPTTTRGLSGVECIVHCAGRAHVMRDVERDPLAAFRAANVEATTDLARRAADAGVGRFVFISSIKVNGEATDKGSPFRPTDTPRPVDAYGVSKAEAEDALRSLSARSGMDVVVIRPVLVYGPGVKGNFLGLLRALERRLPMPLGRVDNRRSFVGLTNLVDLILAAATHPDAAGQTFLVSDGEDLSTPELLRRSAAALGVRAALWPVPVSLLRGAATLVGRQGAIQRLCGSLQVDIAAAATRLGWRPHTRIDAELARTARHFLARGG